MVWKIGQELKDNHFKWLPIFVAEREGFEPPIRFNPYIGLANRRLQPLGHLSRHTNKAVANPNTQANYPVHRVFRRRHLDLNAALDRVGRVLHPTSVLTARFPFEY